MSSNPVNQPVEDQFLRWPQEMEAKQEEQARHMAELREHANRLQQENEHLRIRLETNQVENLEKLLSMYPQPGRIRAKSPPYLTIAIHRRMTSCLQVALHSSVTLHPGAMWKPSPERDHLAIPVRLLVACISGLEERPTGTGIIRS